MTVQCNATFSEWQWQLSTIEFIPPQVPWKDRGWLQISFVNHYRFGVELVDHVSKPNLEVDCSKATDEMNSHVPK